MAWAESVLQGMGHHLAVVGGLLLFLHLAPGSPTHAVQEPGSAPVRGDRGDSTIALWPSPAAPLEVQRRLSAWRRSYESGMAPVDESWQSVLDSVHSDRASHLEAHCARLASAMERLDLSHLTPAPDPVIDLHLYALLDHLFEAAHICSRKRVFATEYLLTEAAGARRRLQVLLQRYLTLDTPASADADGGLWAGD